MGLSDDEKRALARAAKTPVEQQALVAQAHAAAVRKRDGLLDRLWHHTVDDLVRHLADRLPPIRFTTYRRVELPGERRGLFRRITAPTFEWKEVEIGVGWTMAEWCEASQSMPVEKYAVQLTVDGDVYMNLTGPVDRPGVTLAPWLAHIVGADHPVLVTTDALRYARAMTFPCCSVG